MAMLGVALQPFPRKVGSSLAPIPGLMCMTMGRLCFYSLRFLSLLPAVLSAGPRGSLPFAAVIPTVPAPRHVGTGEGECQDCSSPCLRHYFLPGALGLEPLPCPPTAGVAVRLPQDRSGCLSYTWRAGSMMGESQRQDPLRGPPCCPKTCPHLYPCSAACLPGAPDVGRQTLPSGFWRQEAAEGSSVPLALPPHLEMPS